MNAHAQGWFVAVNSSQVSIVVSPINSTYILNVIGEARCCVYAEVYELTYQPLVNELVSLAQRGVEVYVVLSGNVYGGIPEEEYSAVNELISSGVHVSFNYGYDYVHSKVFVIDNDTVIIGSINPTYYGFERDLGIDLVIKNSSMAQVFAGIILNDYHNESITQINYPGIIVSPINSVEYLEDLLSQPGTLYIAMEELYPSSGMYSLILTHSDRLVLVGQHTENEEAVNELGAVMVSDLTAKAIVVGDYVYVGSVNLDYNSLNDNRELGIIIKNPQIAQEITTIIQQWYNENKPQNQQATTQISYAAPIQDILLLILLILIMYILRYTLRPKRRRKIPRL
ncbi:phospholipase D-like domain-containing protein [Vulcanisaeta sp. JCM 16161]